MRDRNVAFRLLLLIACVQLSTSLVTPRGASPEDALATNVAMTHQSTWISERWGNESGWTCADPWCRTCAALIAVAAAGVVALVAMHFGIWCVSPTPTACVQLQMMGIFLSMIFFSTGYMATTLAATALPLAKHFGHGEEFSGLVMSSTYLIAFCGALSGHFAITMGMPQHWKYIGALLALAVEVVVNFACGMIAQGALLGPGSAGTVFIALRAVDGFFNIFAAQMLIPMCVNVVPTSLRVPLQFAFGVALTLGLGVAPLVVAAVTSTSENTSAERFGLAAQFYITCAFTAGMILTVAWIVPARQAGLTAVAEETYWRDKYGVTREPPNTPKSERTQLWLRKMVYICGVVYGVERALVSACLETATAFILETKFMWLTSDTAKYVAIVYLVSAIAVILPVSVLQLVYLESLDQLQLMKICSIIAAVAAAALMYFLSSSPGIILLADGVLYSTCILASSVAEGLALAAAIPGSWFFSVESVFVLRGLACQLSRLAAPLIVRVSVSQSITFYGILQFLMTAGGLVNCWLLARAARAISA